MAAHTFPDPRVLLPQGFSRPPTSPRRALLRVAPAALLLLLSFAACSDDAVPTRPTVGQPLHAVLGSVAPMVVNTLADHDDGSCDDIGDSTDCTLREAIAYAASGATITFADGVTGSITLGSPLSVDKDVTITGPGAASLTLSGTYTKFQVWGGVTASISGLTMTGTASANGAVYNVGTLALSECVITNNQTAGYGGGIWNGSTGDLTVTDCVVSDNGSNATGGGISNGGPGAGGTVTIMETTVSGNNAAQGGGIYNNSGEMTVIRSTVSGNTAGGNGGGIRSVTDAAGSHTTILNSTVSGNTAGSSGYGGSGGGISHEGDSGVLRIFFSTVTTNEVLVSGPGGGVSNNGTVAPIVKGSVIWGNLASTSADDVASGSDTYSYESQGYNLIGAAGSNVDFTSQFNDPTDLTGVSEDEAVLDPLALNDPGTTETHALLYSDAIDHIPEASCTDYTGATIDTDQRGVARPQGSACDIGAYEATSGGSPITLVVNSLDDPGTGGCDETECTLREAVQTPGSDVTITFDPGLTGTIDLIGDLQLNYNVSIVGPGAENLTIDANGSSDANRHGFVVWSTADISGLTVTGGYASAGAGIWIASYATLTLSDMVVTGNTALTDGGAIDNLGTLTVSHSTVSNNTGTYGGGILNEGTLVVDHTTISGNAATSSIGMGGMGGGIYANPTAVTTTVSNSTISGNTAECRGGGIDNMKLIAIEHTTITANTVSRYDPSGGCGGGGLSSATMAGSGAEIVGSIIWGNSGQYGPEDVADLSNAGDFNSLGHNLIGTLGYGVTVSADFSATGDQTGVSATATVLDALALNDPGTTETHALSAGSPAIDAGTCTGLDDVTVADDQRGVERPQGSACDIGAFEAPAGTGPIAPTFTFDLSGLGTVTYGDAPFSVASYASSNSAGAITFALGASSVGCSVSGTGDVTIAGAAVGTDYCVIEASQVAAGDYAAAGPLSQSFNIARATTTVSIDNLPTAGEVDGGFTPAYTSTSDGTKSTTSSTEGVCTVAAGVVSFIAAGTCTLVAHVAEGTNWLAADGTPQNVVVSTATLLTPDFAFDLSRLREKTYGDNPFGVATRRYVSTNSSGEVTFAIGETSVGCQVSTDGVVTITGAAVGDDNCVIEATLAPAAPYAGAGPISQSFQIAKAATTVSISDLPTAAEVGGSFTPEYTTTSDGVKSITSSTTDVCTVDGATGVVSFDAAGTCTLVAHVAEGTNWPAADGDPQSFEVGGVAGPFFSTCTYLVNDKNGQSDITITWENAAPGVTLIVVTDGRDLTKQMAPTPTGSWSVKLNSVPTGYSLWGGSDRKDSSVELVKAGTMCELGGQG